MANGKPSTGDARAMLGVTAAATRSQVVTAFRCHARTVHPDVSHTRDAADRFAALVAAYQVALQAAHGESDGRADLGPGERTALSADPPRAKLHEVATGPTGTAIWEEGQPVLLIGPATAHLPSTRADGRQDARGRGP